MTLSTKLAEHEPCVALNVKVRVMVKIDVIAEC